MLEHVNSDNKFTDVFQQNEKKHNLSPSKYEKKFKTFQPFSKRNKSGWQEPHNWIKRAIS